MTPTAIPVDTARIVDAAIAGDRDAFGALYRAYVDQVFRYVYYRVGGSKPLAEDITADTFVRMLHSIGGYEHRGTDFGAWLVTIARNIIADHFKSSRVKREFPTGEMLDGDEYELAVDVIVLAGMGSAAVLEAVQRLNDLQRECVTLRFLQGLTVAQTAAAMGKGEGAVKTLQYRAISTLARSPHLKKALTVDDSGTHIIALPVGFRADTRRTLFQCGANAGLHHMARHRVTTEIKNATKVAVRAAGLQQITRPVKIRAVQHPSPGARSLDSENIAPLVKAMIDGLRAAGVLINDSPRYVTEVTNAVGDRVRGSQLVLHITEIHSEES